MVSYTYLVEAGSCTDDATVTITNVPVPDAGSDGTLQICETSSPVQLINSLGGTPQAAAHGRAGWPRTTAPLIQGRMHPATTLIWSPAARLVRDATATVTVVITGPDAGTDATISVCKRQAAFPLIDELGGSPDGGGSWTGPGGPHGPQYDPAIDPSGVYTYTVNGGFVHGCRHRPPSRIRPGPMRAMMVHCRSARPVHGAADQQPGRHTRCRWLVDGPERTTRSQL
jgi:hypothetical protein